MMRSSMMRSGMRSGISRIAIQQPRSTGTVCMQYIVVLLVIFMTMFIVGIGVYFAFFKKEDKKNDDDDEEIISPQKCNEVKFIPNKEEPPVICSLDGRYWLRYVEQLCSHLVFLSASVDVANKKASPASGTEQVFKRFKGLRRDGGTIKKLVSFPLGDINQMAMADVDASFSSIRDGWLDGIDIRYIRGNEPELHLFQELRVLADSKHYIIHGVFDSVKIDPMKHFHLASLRVYAIQTHAPFKAELVQPAATIENRVGEYAAAVASANLSSSSNHCIAFSLATIKYRGAKNIGDPAGDVDEAMYCSDEYKRKSATKVGTDLSYFVRSKGALFVFDTPKTFEEKVKKIGGLPNACLLLDGVYYDSHQCECVDKNFKLLRTARTVLWRILRG